MRRRLKPLAVAIAASVGLGAATLGVYTAVQVSAFDSSLAKVYDVPVPNVVRSTDPDVLARGKHLAESIAGCAGGGCHGADLGGGRTFEVLLLGKVTAPNITAGGNGPVYSDGEMARLIRHGIKKDGRSVRLMPVEDFNWLADYEIEALVSYIQAVPPVRRADGPMTIGVLAKLLDRRGTLNVDVARRIEHARVEQAVRRPEATADYGRYLARQCMGCHGEHLSGGRIPGTPPTIPIPSNLTPNDPGLKGWTFEDFDRLLSTGVRKNGTKIDPFMPVDALSKFDATERLALWAYLESLPPREFGAR